jgi:DNA polymerase-4
MVAFCRDCLADVAEAGAPCPACGGARLLAHNELASLAIAHVDCDAFYAAIEKRDDPSLRDIPIVVGGGSQRGVVMTACYEARKFGIRSAMPMFQALRLCPHIAVVRPNMAKYAGVAREMRAMMQTLTPLVEPLSLDEAYLDLSGTERLHGRTPAQTMAWLAREVERTIGITVSVGLSCNKFLAKLASELDKPRGFAVIGKEEAVRVLREKPAAAIRGVGPAMQERLAKDGISRISQLQDMSARDLAMRYGETGLWLSRMAHGEDNRAIEADGERKSLSSETTFDSDIADGYELERILWDQSERVSARAKAAGVGGRTVTLKLKSANFRIRTRSASLEAPTQLSDVIFRVGRNLLERETGTRYRLLGIGLSQIRPAEECDPPDLVDQGATRRAAVEHAMDKVRAKFGRGAVKKGRSL